MKNSFSQSMLYLRTKHRRISLAKLAKLTGISSGTLSRYERGYNIPTIYKAQKIANALGVPLVNMICGAYNQAIRFCGL